MTNIPYNIVWEYCIAGNMRLAVEPKIAILYNTLAVWYRIVIRIYAVKQILIWRFPNRQIKKKFSRYTVHYSGNKFCVYASLRPEPR